MREQLPRLSDDINAAVLNTLQGLLVGLFPRERQSQRSDEIHVDSDSYLWNSSSFLEFMIDQLRLALQRN